ncbi:RagB/SusD family nutrient uptake outer membrane protein [Bacteroides xylanisolvens]|uniref:RagB/SusD family nutrient uptake outer membrane protein n=1 Tax=Bacteroides xylanisolvens TaxID=371601 RepID=UPI003AB916C8
MKNMKLYKKALLILSLGLTLNSCLDLDPQDQLADGNLWGAADDFKYFATNFYGWTRDFKSVISDGAHSDWRSDLMTSSSVNMYSNGSNPIPTSDGNYTSNYAHIRRCNLLLQKAASFSGNGDISRYVAEAKFFRAYSYFDLVQLFGNVIITKEPLDITSPELRMSRNDRSEVIDFVIQDLKDAAEVLPETITTDDEGRISKWGAYAFLSRVALYEGTWQQNRNNEERGKALLSIAADAAKKVIDSKQFELFKPAALGEMAYKYLFILENVQSNPANLTKSANKEYIFYRRHDETIAPIGTNITHGCVANVQYINRKFVNMYLCSNGLPIDHAKSADVFKGYGGLTTEFENRDNRMKNCLLAHGTKYWDNDKPRIDWKGMDGEDATNAITCNVFQGSGYQNQKWGTERKVADTFEGYDFPIIRYAEVLLNYAEAMYELGTTGKALDDALNISLNLVRLRVNPDMPKLTTSFASENSLNMREEIRRERTIELYNEGFRVDDLKRWNTAIVEMPKPILGVKWTGTDFATSWAGASNMAKDSDGCLILENSRRWGGKNDLYPLPVDQCQLNPNLGQNPGWQ